MAISLYIPFILLPTFLALLLVVVFDRKSLPLHISIGMILWLIFCLMYVNVTDIVAQDRWSYYMWYLRTYFFTGHYDQDMGFTILLSFLPDGLSDTEFNFFLSSLFIALLSAALFIAWRNRIITLQQCSLVLLGLIMDRLFVDLSMNAIRSSLVALLFIIWLVSKKKWLIFPIVTIGYGFHERMTFLLVILYLLSTISICIPRLRDALVIAGLLMFVTRLMTGGGIFSGLSIWESYVSGVESEAIVRGFTYKGFLTISLAIQITISMIIPMLICHYEQWRLMLLNYGGYEGTHSVDQRKLLNFSIVCMAVSLILYPDIQLIQRIFVISMVGLFMMMPIKSLRFYVIAKFAIFSMVFFSMFPD